MQNGSQGKSQPQQSAVMSQIVLCPKCGVRVAIKTEQQGRRVQCPSCEQPFSAPAALGDGNQGDTEEVNWLSLPVPSGGQTPSDAPAAAGSSATSSSQQKHEHSGASVSDYLQSAEDADAESESEQAKREGQFNGWAMPVLGIFKDPGVILHLVVLAIAMALPVGITVFDRKYGFATFPFMAIGFSLVMTCGLSIVQAIANGESAVDEWPTIDLWAWLESSMVVASAMICSVAPALFLATLFSAETLVTVSLMLCGAHLLFPLVVLSILDTQSVFVPLSLDVIRSCQSCRKECQVFFAIAGVVLALGPLYFFLTPATPVMAGVGVAFCVLIAFLYAALLGRLAYSFGQVTEPGVAE